MSRTTHSMRAARWSDPVDAETARRNALVLCAVARSVISGALVASVPLDPLCEEALLVVERWSAGRANAVEVRNAEREMLLRRIDAQAEEGPRGEWRLRVCDAVLRACEEARAALDGNPLERTSQTSLM